MAMETEGVANEIAFPGLNPLQFTNTPNSGVVFFNLKPFGERENSAEEILAEINGKIAGIQEGFAFALMPPPIQGLGNGSGYSLFIEDRTGLGYGALQNAVSIATLLLTTDCVITDAKKDDKAGGEAGEM